MSSLSWLVSRPSPPAPPQGRLHRIKDDGADVPPAARPRPATHRNVSIAAPKARREDAARINAAVRAERLERVARAHVEKRRTLAELAEQRAKARAEKTARHARWLAVRIATKEVEKAQRALKRAEVRLAAARARSIGEMGR